MGAVDTGGIVMVAPPRMTTLSAELQRWCHGDPSESAGFAVAYQEVASARGTGFLDASAVCEVSPVDGVHLDEHGQRRLGLAVAEKALEMIAAPAAN